MNEFELIQYFDSLSKIKRPDTLLGIGDDAALLQPPSGQCLAVSTDTLVSGVHFFKDDSPDDIAYKALAVNLSDLAAMGADPAWVTLALTLPQAHEKWLQAFCRGFFELIDQYQLQLVGGDTTQGPLSLSLQVIGFVPPQLALRRSGAKAGDQIYVTGTLGDAGLALQMIKQQRLTAHFSASSMKLRRPKPQIEAGLALRGIASSAIDISDGLASDLNHILVASHVGGHVCVDDLPLSTTLRKLPIKEAHTLALSAGDDYELCFTVAPENESKMLESLNKLALCTRIGTVEATPGLRMQKRDGTSFSIKKMGFRHF